MNRFTTEVDDAFVNRERNKARELRESQWWKRQVGQGRCYYCGKKFPPKNLTMDHVVPLTRGGKSTRRNVVPACKECNNKKKYMLPVEWEEYLASLNKNDIE